MTKTGLAFCAALLACVLAAVSCLPEARLAPLQPAPLWPAPVKITGVTECGNYSLSCCIWLTTPLPGNAGALPAREGDLLFMQYKKAADDGAEAQAQPDDQFFFPYRQADGASLAFRTEKCRLLLNGTTVSVAVSAENGGWEWLEKAPDKELSALRFLSLEEDEIAPAHVRAIERLARLNPHIGLAIKGKAVLQATLPLFDPRSLFLGGTGALDADGEAILAGCASLEALWFSADGLKSLEFLARLPRLRAAMIANWDPRQTGSFPPGCASLKSLTLTDFKGKDLACIGNLPGLRQLDLMDGDSAVDVGGLSGLSQIEILNVFADTAKMDLSVLEKCENLRWLGLGTKGLTQGQFGRIISGVPRLRALALLADKDDKDLSPLKDLPELEELIVVGMQPDLAQLGATKKLRFLMLQRDCFEKTPAAVRRLRADLPECLIVPGKPLCLGSGWILLLIPGAAAAWLAARRRGRRPAAAERGNAPMRTMRDP